MFKFYVHAAFAAFPSQTSFDSCSELKELLIFYLLALMFRFQGPVAAPSLPVPGDRDAVSSDGLLILSHESFRVNTFLSVF